jgi:hypothetical protein
MKPMVSAIVELEMGADEMLVIVVIPHHDFFRAIHLGVELSGQSGLFHSALPQ